MVLLKCLMEEKMRKEKAAVLCIPTLTDTVRQIDVAELVLKKICSIDKYKFQIY